MIFILQWWYPWFFWPNTLHYKSVCLYVFLCSPLYNIFHNTFDICFLITSAQTTTIVKWLLNWHSNLVVEPVVRVQISVSCFLSLGVRTLKCPGMGVTISFAQVRFWASSYRLEAFAQRVQEVKGVLLGGNILKTGPQAWEQCLEEWQVGRHSVCSFLCHLLKTQGSDPETAPVKHFSGKLRPACHFSFEQLGSH